MYQFALTLAVLSARVFIISIKFKFNIKEINKTQDDASLRTIYSLEDVSKLSE